MEHTPLPGIDARPSPAVLQDFDRLYGTGCRTCDRVLCGHEVVFSLALGFKSAPRCLACLAQGLSRRPGELRDEVYRHVQDRACFRSAWGVANEREGVAGNALPACLWRENLDAPTVTPPALT